MNIHKIKWLQKTPSYTSIILTIILLILIGIGTYQLYSPEHPSPPQPNHKLASKNTPYNVNNTPKNIPMQSMHSLLIIENEIANMKNKSWIKGTQIPNGIRLDADGLLKIDDQLRIFIEHILLMRNQYTIQTLKDILIRYGHAKIASLSHGNSVDSAQQTYESIINQYIDYLEKYAVMQPKSQEPEKVFSEIKQLRSTVFGENISNRLFAQEQIHVDAGIERILKKRQENLTLENSADMSDQAVRDFSQDQIHFEQQQYDSRQRFAYRSEKYGVEVAQRWQAIEIKEAQRTQLLEKILHQWQAQGHPEDRQQIRAMIDAQLPWTPIPDRLWIQSKIMAKVYSEQNKQTSEQTMQTNGHTLESK